MNALLALGITAVFSSWVWSLKRELAGLQVLVPAGGGESASDRSPQPHPYPHLAQHATPHQAHRDEHAVKRAVTRNGSGVPVWKIEA